MTEQPQPTVWPTLRYDDASAAIRFLVDVCGFRAALVVPGEDPADVRHAELRWPEGGGVMLGSTKFSDGVHALLRPGGSSVCVISDRVDEIHSAVVAAGAEVVSPLEDTEYGSHTFTMRDAEGNIWTFGTYRGAP